VLALKAYRDKAQGLPDLLPYAACIASGVVLCKSGSLLAAWEFSAPDTASSTADELAFVCDRANQVFRSMGSGWMCHVDALRTIAPEYPAPGASHFPDPVTAAMDEERRLTFAHGAFFATRTYLTITYTPEVLTDKLSNLANSGAQPTENFLKKHLRLFEARLLELEDSLASIVILRRLADHEETDEHGTVVTRSELLSYLQECVTGSSNPVNLPMCPMYLDAILGGEDLVGGLEPKVGEKYLMILALDGLPHESWPAMLSALDGLPIAYRFSSRFIFLDQSEALAELDKYRKTWRQQIFRIFDALLSRPDARANRDALRMSEDSEEAIAAVQSGLVGAGFYTANIVLLHEDAETLTRWTRELRRAVQTVGFGCRIEEANRLEAWLGSHPGNGFANIRRPLIHTLPFADLLPLSSIWAGREHNPCPFYPPDSPPLMQCATDGATPFRLNLHVGDLGHTLIFGPTGAGKSTLLATLAAQFRRYPDATIVAFDKGMSLYPLCKAVGGTHYAVGADDDELAFCPLQHVNSDTEQAWAEEYIATLCSLRKVTVLPAHRNAIHAAMTLLRDNPADMRSLTDFYHLLQSDDLKKALLHYTQKGAMGRLLDATSDKLKTSRFLCFEIEELMNMGNENLIPVLLHIFHRAEKLLQGQPAMFVLDECWIMLGHEVFRAKIREWLKVFRKTNCAVVLSTQSLTDAIRSGIMDVLVESCPTKILLPNYSARQDGQIEAYRGMGLNARQIEIIAQATPKRDYYVVSPEGRRLIQLALGSFALLFVGASDKESISRIKELERRFGPSWPEQWIHHRRKSCDSH
jgi:type IV secretion system protein VirB4